MNASRYPLESPTVAAKITCLVLDGQTDRQVAEAVSTSRRRVSHQAITAFRRRHRETFERAKQAILDAAEDYAIASKVARLADLQFIRDKCMAIVERRGGLEADDTKIAANGETVTVSYFDAALVKEWRGALSDAAAEMGERTKINIDARKQTANFIDLMGGLGDAAPARRCPR